MNTFCGYYNQGICQSCDLLKMDYLDQIRLKEKLLSDSLAGIKLPKLLPSVTSNPQSFRNKAKFTVTGTMEKPVIGLLGLNNLDEGRELLDCPVHLPEINSALPIIKDFIQKTRLVPYNIKTQKGELKGLIIFYSKETNEMYLRFISRSKEPITRIIKFHHELLKSLPTLKVISVNIQPIPHAILEGGEEVFITGNTRITQKLDSIEMKIGPQAFVQTNQEIAMKLYQTASLWVKEIHPKRFMELFSGLGAFSFFCGPFIEEGLGIEINPNAVKEANRTASDQNLKHLKFKSADAKDVAGEIKDFSPDVLLVNPPRAGLKDALKLIQESKPRTFIYSSCSHETLGEDLRKLDSLYEIKRIQLFDMFPQTSHFETLVELTLR